MFCPGRDLIVHIFRALNGCTIKQPMGIRFFWTDLPRIASYCRCINGHGKAARSPVNGTDFLISNVCKYASWCIVFSMFSSLLAFHFLLMQSPLLAADITLPTPPQFHRKVLSFGKWPSIVCADTVNDCIIHTPCKLDGFHEFRNSRLKVDWLK